MQLEALGIDMTERKQMSETHVLLIPEGLRLVGKDGKVGSGSNGEGGLQQEWDKAWMQEVETSRTVKCLWELVDLPAKDESQFPEAVMGFTNRWGLLNLPNLGAKHIDQPSSIKMSNWGDSVEEVRAFLKLLIATEAGDPVEDDVVETLWSNDPDFPGSLFGEHGEPISGTELMKRVQEAVSERWDAESRPKRIQYQRSMAIWTLSGLADLESEGRTVPVWDDRGRRLGNTAYGVKGIVGASLQDIFMSLEMDVFLCSVCGKPFPFEESPGKRRPRIGVQRFCSPECRASAKRKATLASWHRNKDRKLLRRRNPLD